MLSDLENAKKRFCAVRDSISPVDHPVAYREAFCTVYRFYRDYTVDEAIGILLEYEAGSEKARTILLNYQRR